MPWQVSVQVGKMENAEWETSHELAALESICTKCSLENVCIAALNVIQNTCRIVGDPWREWESSLGMEIAWEMEKIRNRQREEKCEALTVRSEWRKSKKINKRQIVVGKHKCASFSLYANCKMCDEVDGSAGLSRSTLFPAFPPFHSFCNHHEWIQIQVNVCTRPWAPTTPPFSTVCHVQMQWLTKGICIFNVITLFCMAHKNLCLHATKLSDIFIHPDSLHCECAYSLYFPQISQ